jgi:hypothetical protein
VDAFAQRWHIPPSAVLDEPAWLVCGIATMQAEEADGAGNVTPDAPSEDDAMRALLASRSVPVGQS